MLVSRLFWSVLSGVGSTATWSAPPLATARVVTRGRGAQARLVLSVTVTVAVGWAPSAAPPVGLARASVNVSIDSGAASPQIVTVTVLLVSPGLKVSVPFA